MIKGQPIHIDEVAEAKIDVIPSYVFDIVNRLIISHWNGYSAIIKTNEIVNELLLYCNSDDNSLERHQIFDRHYLDFEGAYELQGWKVRFDKPGYNETYDSYFEFTRKK